MHRLSVLVFAPVAACSRPDRGPAPSALTTRADSPALAASSSNHTSAPAPFKPLRLAAGGDTTCATGDDGTTRCWGKLSSTAGYQDTQVGRPAMLEALQWAQEIALGAEHGCLRKIDGTVHCWRWDESTGAHNLRAPGPELITVSGVSGAARISVGDTHACASVVATAVKCWSNEAFSAPEKSRLKMPPRMVETVTVPDAVRVHAGESFTCALRKAGPVMCWTSHSVRSAPMQGAPQRAPGVNNVLGLACGRRHCCAWPDHDDSVRCWGSNSRGQLGRAPISDLERSPTAVVIAGLHDIDMLALGDASSCALMHDKTVRCWGANDDGQLGDGTNVDRTTPVRVHGVENVEELVAGARHTCARVGDSSVRCWGANEKGQLGDGTKSAKNTAVVIRW